MPTKLTATPDETVVLLTWLSRTVAVWLTRREPRRDPVEGPEAGS
jgi:hypothetical protein